MKRFCTQLCIVRPALQVTLVTFAMLVASVRAQETPTPPVPAPPPPKVISPEERAKLDEEKDDAKDRLRTTLEFAEIHLNKAQSLTDQHDFHAASTELGRYAALIEDALAFLSPMSRDRNKTRDLYKRLELALRAHGPRITSIRRVTPLEYAVWIKQLEDFARKGRTEALNSFYGHTVVRDAPAMPTAEKKPKQPKDNSLAPGSKP